VLECLQSETNKLTDACEKEVFRIKKLQTVDNTIDYALITMCSDSIELFCPNTDKEKVFDCLKVRVFSQSSSVCNRYFCSHRKTETKQASIKNVA